MTDRRYEHVRNATGFNLARGDAPAPQPGPGEIAVQVRAVALNRRDIAIRDLSYPVGGADRFTPCSDASGEVIAVGEGVTAWKPGDRVCSTFFQNWESGRVTRPAAMSSLGGGRGGVLADRIVIADQGVVAAPEAWSHAEAASLACAGVTAWTALMTLGQMQRDDWVLIIGTGGVALFALQIAVAAGAKVIVLSSSDEKLERAAALGAQGGINYATTPDWSEAVRGISGGGVQHALELGGAGTLARTLASMAIGGHVALIGALDGFGGDIPAGALVMAGLRVSAVLVGPRTSHRQLIDFMVEHDLRPIIDSEHSFDNAEDAYRRTAEGAFGKVIITF